ncbi:glycoside hydrolase family 32 protein [Microbacterium sp. MPKO10]|uniref:glycoside hydrolase family 32 protein n=1 Tax=Microbacterium sp. MPKO10 TaxID=2989818 RepID=UPI002235DBF1|nr:glycoside hydrolase family 32 protein [Microbacterium sp. MPKO10]MCW4459826.1 GH32 C-terminal domain-containing protein [Microbacterium sp. MPKO10]
MSHRGFYQPVSREGAWVGDVIPWQEDGTFHLFYLHETRRNPPVGMPWRRVVTDNLVDFQDAGESIASGGPEAEDFNIYTGSIVTDDRGIHHAFYTGQNPDRRGSDGRPLQLVMHATSNDGMESWQRHPDHTFGATEGYEGGDWRDPFVFWDEEAQVWRMLITARHSEGPVRRRGVIAQCTSTDLVQWAPAEPFWDPRRYVAHECPEVFEWNGWWYLVYSEFSETFTTRYRLSRNLNGPWIVPPHDSLDGRAFYAAKSAARDGRRFFFGWIATREGAQDDGAWQWAGTLSVLEATQQADGTLAFHPAPELLNTFDELLPVTLPERRLSAPDGYADSVALMELPESARIVATFDVSDETTECGLLLRASADGNEGYALRLEPKRHRLVFDRWPRKQTGSEQWQISGDVPYAIELERSCELAAGQHTLDVIIDGSVCVATVDDAVVLSTRLYDRPTGHAGVFVGEGNATVTDFAVYANSVDHSASHTSYQLANSLS